MDNLDTIVVLLITLVTVCVILLIILLFYGYSQNKKEKEAKEKEKMKKYGKKYILNVVRFHEDGEVSSHWHGWNTDKWLFTYDEAIERKDRIKHMFDEIEILEYDREKAEMSGGVKSS